jgi:lysophospholipase L1-like esterase
LRAAAAAALAAAAIAGCGAGGAASQTAAGHQQRHHHDYLVAALGDSITAGAPLWDPNPAVRAGIGAAASRRSQYEYWAARAVRGVRFRNCGVSGERTDQIAARLGCAHGADALIVQGGINDLVQTFGAGRRLEQRAVDAAARNINRMVARGRRMGLAVLIANLLPLNDASPRLDAEIARTNAKIVAIARRRHVAVLPFHATLERPPGSDRMRSDLTAEGLHPSIAGYALLGRDAVAPALRRLVKRAR